MKESKQYKGMQSFGMGALLLGATAGRGILGDSFRVTRDRGRFVQKNGLWIMPTYHPAALLRDETNVKKREAWQDLQAVRDKLQTL